MNQSGDLVTQFFDISQTYIIFRSLPGLCEASYSVSRPSSLMGASAVAIYASRQQLRAVRRSLPYLLRM